MPTRTKSASPQARARVRSVIREILAKDFGGNQTRMAEALNVNQSTISNIVKGLKGYGTVIIEALERYDRGYADRAKGGPGDPVEVLEMAANLEKEGASPHVSRVVARAVVELGNTGEAARTAARGLVAFVSALEAQRLAGTSQTQRGPIEAVGPARVRQASSQ